MTSQPMQQRQMLECHLVAPTLSGRPEGSPTLTNLDRETVYELKLRKLRNDELDQFNKLEEDQLLVSIRLGFKSESLPEGITERELFQLWKDKHPSERLFDLQFEAEQNEDEPNISASKIQYIENHNQDGFIDVASYEWNAGKEVQFGLRFHCVSSQFPFVRHPTSDAIPVFELHVNVSSQNVTNWIYYFVCEVQLYWPERSAQVNHLANLQSHFPPETEEEVTTLVPSCPYTIMKLTTMNREQRALLRRNFPQIENGNDNTQQVQVYQIPEDYAEMTSQIDPLEGFIRNIWGFTKKHIILWSKRQDHFKYAPRYSRDLFVDSQCHDGSSNDSFKGFFYERGTLFPIEISKNTENNLLITSGQLVKTTVQLDLSERKFTKEELFDWKVDKLSEMLNFDYDESTFLDSVLDIRQVGTNCIQIYWVHLREFQLKWSFRINCLSNEFEFNGPNYRARRDDIGSSFLLTISNVLQNTKDTLETVQCKLYSVPSSASVARQRWLNQNARYTTRHAHPIVVLNQHLQGHTEIHWKNVLIVSTAALFAYFSYRKCQRSLRRWRIDRINRAAEMKAKLERGLQITRMEKEKAKAALGEVIFKRKLAPDEIGTMVGMGALLSACLALAFTLFDFSSD